MGDQNLPFLPISERVFNHWEEKITVWVGNCKHEIKQQGNE
jgi:hypothetical protein